jgi:hypothetical protein
MANQRNVIKSLLIVVVCITLIAYFQSVRAQTSLGRVALVVQFLDGSIEGKCIEIDKKPFTGYDVLSASGYSLITDISGSIGVAICKIGSEGCSADNCFCSMPNYWAYWHLGKDANGQDAWQYSNLGASNFIVSAGDVEGWRFGEGAPPAEKPAFEEICTSPTATATTPVSVPLPTHTSRPTVYAPSQPQSPTRWATAVIIGGATPTGNPSTATPTNAPPPPATLTPDATKIALESQNNPVIPTQTASTEQTPTATPVLAEENQPQPPIQSAVTTTAKQPKSNKRATASGEPVAGLEKSQAAPSGVSEQKPIQEQGESQAPADPGGLSKRVLALGGLAGLGSFAFLFTALTGGLLILYLIRRK